MKLRRRQLPENVIRNQRQGNRCDQRHPIWRCVRCELENFDHLFHTAENDTYVWHDERRGWRR
jgi:hypothetical protein